LDVKINLLPVTLAAPEFLPEIDETTRCSRCELRGKCAYL